MRGRLAWLVAAVLCACVEVPVNPERETRAAAREPAPVSSTSGAPARLVMVSVSGLGSERYFGDGGEPPAMPFLAELAQAGVAAERVEPVAPASTYPAHVSLVTGRTPSLHGVGSDRWAVQRASATPTDKSGGIAGTPLWQAVANASLRSAALGWPGSWGAAIDFLLPELRPGVTAEAWPNELRVGTSAALVERAIALGAATPDIGVPGPARDALLVRVACELERGSAPPALLLLHLSQTQPVLREEGPDSQAARAAFARVDSQLSRLVDCLRAANLLATTALLVVGDHGMLPVHSTVETNVALGDAGLLVPQAGGAAVQRWSALSRSNGGSAFVYAKGEEDAVLARRALEEAAKRTRAFRVVPASELLRWGADPEAWFGLEAEPGYLFGDGVGRALVHAAAQRGGAGYFPEVPEMAPGFVAWGRGIRRSVRVPLMHQTDVAPTAAMLLGTTLGEIEGRALIGAVDLSSTPAASRAEAPRAR